MIEMFLILPPWLAGTVFFVLGIIVGSFLNVVIYRLHTGKSLGGHSHCLSCGERLSWVELLPLLSYLLLQARCRHCGAHITSRYFLVELATGVIFSATVFIFVDPLLLFLHLLLFSVLMVIAVYDIRHTIIPDEMVIAGVGISFFIVIFAETGVDTMYFGGFTWSMLIGTICPSGFYALLWYISKGRWIGLGDAKLAVPLGLLVSYIGGAVAAFSLIVLSFWVGAVVSIGALLLQKVFPSSGMVKKRRYFTIKSEVPFAPFLMASFVMVYVYNIDVFVVTERILSTVGL